MPDRKTAIVALIVGLAYYAGAWIGVTQTITPEGIAVLWPPNAVILAAFLILPRRYWPSIAAAVMAAEIIADLPVFPLWAAIAFGGINLFEATLAAFLIRRVAGEPFDFDSRRNGGTFLLFGPLLASATAGLMGATVYIFLARADTGFVHLWQLWWFGDALGLLILTPLFVALWRWLGNGRPAVKPLAVVEVTAFWLALVVVGLFAFNTGEPGSLAYFIKPAWLAPFAIVASVRLGVTGTAATVALIAAITLGHLVNGIYPFRGSTPQYEVWLAQEYLVAIAVVALGFAILMREFRDQRENLRGIQRNLERSNIELEKRVRERTSELEQVNATLEQVNRKLRVIATTDDLTGIANRRQIYAEAGRELERLRRSGETASTIMIDLDHFKRINDSYGHEAGDRVLKAIQEPIQSALRAGDLVGRIGGEEFLVVLAGISLDTAADIAERVRRAIEKTEIEYYGDTITVTASLGVAEWDGRSTLDSLVHDADDALYRAKQNGRNRVETQEPAEAE